MTRKATVVSTGVVLGAVVVVLLTMRASGVIGGPPEKLVKQVSDLKLIVAEVQGTFQQGKLLADRDPRDRKDARVFIINTMLDKLRFSINKNEKNDSRRQAALAKVVVAQATMDEFIPKFDQAVVKRDLAATKGFLNDMAALQQHLDSVLNALKS